MESICIGQNGRKETRTNVSGGNDGEIFVDSVGCFSEIDFNSLMVSVVKKFHFADLEVAYNFYNEYGRAKGFSILKSKKG